MEEARVRMRSVPRDMVTDPYGRIPRHTGHVRATTLGLGLITKCGVIDNA